MPATYASMWDLTDPDLRLARAQAWLWNNRKHDDVSADDANAGELARSPSLHPLWDDFARTELMQFWEVWPDAHWENVTVARKRRVVSLDLEIVLFVDTRTVPQEIEQTRGPAPFAAWLMRHRDRDGRWRLASHSDFPPVPGWPPSFPQSVIVAL
jgi:hypothetical protein